MALEGIISYLSNGGLYWPEELQPKFEEAQRRIHEELQERYFVMLPLDRVSYYEHPDLSFTEQARNNFGSGVFDMREASRCLALRCNTAAVFHLMRLLEIGLAALASEFGVPTSNKTWAPIIDEIESKIRNRHKEPRSKSKPDCKEQQEFFAQVASHFGVLKDAYRNRTAHARAKFDDQEAMAIMLNVKGFMDKLATRIKELS